MIKFKNNDVYINDIVYGNIEPVFGYIYVFYSHSKQWSYSAKDLRQIADKLDELNAKV